MTWQSPAAPPTALQYWLVYVLTVFSLRRHACLHAFLYYMIVRYFQCSPYVLREKGLPVLRLRPPIASLVYFRLVLLWARSRVVLEMLWCSILEAGRTKLTKSQRSSQEILLYSNKTKPIRSKPMTSVDHTHKGSHKDHTTRIFGSRE